MTESLLATLKYSEALSRFLKKNPETLSNITGYSKLKKNDMANAIRSKCGEILANIRCDENALKSTKQFKYSFLCALTARYLSQHISPEEFAELWSLVAECCCELVYNIAYIKAEKKYGAPIAINEEGKNDKFRFTIIALGKLGAGELNFSSDIDLIFIYNTKHGAVANSPDTNIDEFATYIAKNITFLLSTADEDGFCFRVDNDLRPAGNQGNIANSLDAAVDYYNYWGSTLERMMLIRANPVAGDIELGLKFVALLKPFIYRRSCDTESLKKIKEMKEAIGQEAKKETNNGIDIKRGEGGIREVEFVVQSIQLLNGGKNEKLITRNTFDALKRIKEFRLLSARESDNLRKAYIFLRHLENMLQIPNEEQTHVLPNDEKKRQLFATMMGYNDNSKKSAVQAFMTDFDERTATVKRRFDNMFETDIEKQQMTDAILTNISTCSGNEEEADSLPWFKREEIKRIQYMDLREGMPPAEVSLRLSLVADVIISEAYNLASQPLRETYGPPLSDEKQHPIASLAIIGLGKLGGREIDYASDLDIMFIYSNAGFTAGPQKITNQEYFTKLSQRIISLITLATRYGKAYQIDTDLRPSGRAGVLVSPLSVFKNYHRIEAAMWERQSLIKARPIAGDPKFCELVKKQLDELRYEAPLPHDLKNRIHELRIRMEKERAKESDGKYNVKLGRGGLMDIEMVVQYLQLRHGKEMKDVRSTNTIDTLKTLTAKKILDERFATLALKNYEFFRRLLSRIRLLANHAIDHIDTNSEIFPQIASSLNSDKEELIAEYLKCREEVRQMYDYYFT